MGLPKISLVTPCFNSEKYIEQTLDSIIGQRGNINIDHVIVDGGSTDKTMKILKMPMKKKLLLVMMLLKK